MPSHPRTSPPPRITNYRDLLVWQKSIDLCVAVYRACKRLPRSETFALGDQLRRAAVAVASNIAEGHERSHTGEYLHCLSRARGELAEVETQLVIAVRVDYLTKDEVDPVLAAAGEISRMLAALSKKLGARITRGSTPRSRPSPRPSLASGL